MTDIELNLTQQLAEQSARAAADLAYLKGIVQSGGIAESNNDWKAAAESAIADAEASAARARMLGDLVRQLRDALSDTAEHLAGVTGADARPGSDSGQIVAKARAMIERVNASL